MRIYSIIKKHHSLMAFVISFQLGLVKQYKACKLNIKIPFCLKLLLSGVPSNKKMTTVLKIFYHEFFPTP